MWGVISRNGDDKQNRNGDNGADDRVTESIISTTWRNIIFPQVLKQKYCFHFVDTSKVCDFGTKCKHKHANFSNGYDNNDLQPILDFVKETKGLKWTDRVPIHRHVSSSNNRN